MCPANSDDIKAQVEFEKLLRSAWIERRRGDYDSAAKQIAKALEIDSTNIEAREFAADVLFAKGKLEESVRAYKQILEDEPGREWSETQYARAVVMIAEGKRQQHLLQEMLENPAKFRRDARNPTLAAVLSFAPGFGHIYCGQLVKGIVLFCVVMLCWTLFAVWRPDVSAQSQNVSQATRTFFVSLSVWDILFIVLAVFTHIYAILDAPNVAKKTGEHKDLRDMTIPHND